MFLKLINLIVALIALCNVVLYVESGGSYPRTSSTPNNFKMTDLPKDRLSLYQRIRKTQQSVQQQQRLKRSVHQYHLELLLVVDQSMVDFHGDELVPYLTSILAAVQHRFKYALVDGSIQLQLTDIVQLKNSEIQIDYTNGSTILNTFCSWKQRAKAQNVAQHDAALLLTRNQIPAQELGRSMFNSICEEQSCLIARDNGLGTVNTIAHELGHVLGAFHDEDELCEPFNKFSNTKYLMSDTIGAQNQWWQWSECSIWTMTDNLRNLKEKCLKPNPETEYLKLNLDHRFMGQHYSLDKQCELLNRSTPHACQFRPCEHLRCKQFSDSSSYCFPENSFWADGTDCGTGKWCENGQCVQADQEAIQQLKDENWIQEIETDKSKINTTKQIIILLYILIICTGICIYFIVPYRQSKIHGKFYKSNVN